MKENTFRELFASVILTSNSKNPLRKEILPAAQLNEVSALEIYSSGYIVRLTEALGEIFETVWRVLGDEEFFNVSETFLRGVPSISYNLSDYGKGFPAFLDRKFPKIEFLRELAEFEYLFAQLFHRPAGSTIDPKNSLEGKDPGDLRLIFSDSAFFLKNNFPVYELWKKRKEESCQIPEEKNAEFLLLGKKGQDIRIEVLDEWRWTFGRQLQENKTLLEAVELIGMPAASGTKAVSDFLSTLIQGGFLKDIKIS
ncbi:PF09836 family protein [Leptospira broomii serovar Hurstbridge str. 5399]|uniref:PF09836 family protein n=1 Tax=Leptospira broomii serovar Hurstbridge str. 5399 TaxID=1049789 RepID=T0F8U1_9LEPT|nr:DNA-binding domain-containing protein [Leptospira broomii]EQA43932.1 PF09836 family protein [Leptospira broomii serovar Hurstbridge str. 5399]